jgi:hypothetical protein
MYSDSKKDDKKGPNRCNVNNKENLMKLVRRIEGKVDMKQGKEGWERKGRENCWSTARGEKADVKKGGNWIVRLNLFASSC